MLGILGKKIGMTQVFHNGDCVPVTVVESGPCKVLYKKVLEKDGYSSLALGFEAKREKSTTKPMKGVFKKANVTPLKFIREFRTKTDDTQFEVGQDVNLSILENNNFVDVTGVSIGKGFQGGMKRHGFSGGPASHGASLFHRGPGSIGPRIVVRKGTRMAGRMGNDRVTVQSLQVIKIDVENNLLLVKGAVPGPKNSFLIIKPSIKKINTLKKGR